MSSRSVAERPPIDISELLDNFHRLSKASELFHDNPISRAGEFEMTELASTIGEQLCDRLVVVRELPIARQIHEVPIQRFAEDHGYTYRLGVQAQQRRDGTRRSHPASDIEFFCRDNRAVKKAKGEVEGVDPLTASIVVRPNAFGSMFDRLWVKPVAADGCALVDFKKIT